MRKGRVLVLCDEAPWARLHGAATRNFWLIEALAKTYFVDLVVSGDPTPMPSSFAAIVGDYAHFAGRDATVREYVENRLGRLPHTAIQVDLPMWHALPRRDVIPIVYNTHRDHSAILSSSPLRFDALSLGWRERSLLARATVVVVGGGRDLQLLTRQVPSVQARGAVVCDGITISDYASARAAEAPAATVLLLGTVNGRSNAAGVRWFLRRVLPIVCARQGEVRIRVAGAERDVVNKFKRQYPQVEWSAEELSPAALAGAAVVAIPTSESGDARPHVLEAWAAGRPAVTTTAGAAGLAHTPDRDLVIADDPAAFAARLEELLQDAALRRSLAENGAISVQAHDWTRIGEQLRSIYDPLCGDGVPRRIATVTGEAVLSGRT